MTDDFRAQPPGPCQLCGSRDLTRFAVPDAAQLWHCTKCDLYQYGELPATSHYNVDYQRFYDAERGRKLRTAMVRLNRIAAVVEAVRPRLLDVGCSVGVTIEAAQRRGWDAVGVDVSQDVVDLCCQRGLPAVLSDGVRLPFPDRSFDVVTAWHVIEHVGDVRQTLAEWFRVLRPGGVLAIETPDGSSPKVKLLGRRYRRFWKPEHTYTFSPRSLEAFFRHAGFDIVRQPWTGKLSNFSPSQATYAVAYQLQLAVKYRLGLRKAFQIFARRPEDDQQQLPRAA